MPPGSYRSPPLGEYTGIGDERWRKLDKMALPNTGMLSFLRFQVQSVQSLSDASTQAGSLWFAVLDYLRAMPGCSTFYWGPSLNSPSQQEIELLLPFESSESWQM